MQEQITQRSDDTAAIGEVRTELAQATALTRGDNTGSSEDKRYIYN